MWTLVREEFEFESPTFSGEEGQKVYIGRVAGDAAHQHVVCVSSVVSRKHCLLEFRNGDWFICDLGSMNGTFVNDTKLEASNLKEEKYVWTKLKVGDFIGLGAQIMPDEEDEPEHPREHYFIFKFAKMRPETTPSPTKEVEEVTIDSDDDEDDDDVIEEPSSPKNQSSSHSSPPKVPSAIKPILCSKPPAKSVLLSPAKRPGPASWKRSMEAEDNKKSYEKNINGSGTKRKVEDASSSPKTQEKKRRKSEEVVAEEEEPPRSSKKSSKTPQEKPSPAFKSPKPASFKSPKPPSFQSPKPASFQSPKPASFQSPKPASFKSPKPPSSELKLSSSATKKKAVTTPVRSRKDPSPSSSSSDEDMIPPSPKGRPEKSHKKLSSSKKRKPSDENHNTPAKRNGQIQQSKSSSLSRCKPLVFSDSESASDSVQEVAIESSDDEEVDERQKRKEKSVKRASNPSVSHRSLQCHSKGPKSLEKKVTLKLRRVVDLEEGGAVKWDERARRKLSGRNVKHIERQLKSLNGWSDDEEILPLPTPPKQQGLKGSSSHYNKHVDGEATSKSRSSLDKRHRKYSMESNESLNEIANRKHHRDQPPPVKTITYSDSEDDFEAECPSPEYEQEEEEEEAPPEAKAEVEPAPVSSTIARKAILIAPPPGAFAPKRRMQKQMSFPSEPPSSYGHLDPLARKKKLRELAEKEREEKARSVTPSTSHHIETLKVKLTSKSRNDMLVGTILNQDPAPREKVVPLPDKDVMRQMPLSVIGDSMKTTAQPAGGVQKAARTAHNPRDKILPSMKNMMHKGAAFPSADNGPGPSKATATAARPESSSRTIRQEPISPNERQPPVDPELPYKEILTWNPKWLEEAKNQKESPPSISSKPMVSTLHEYVAYDDYVNIFYPLIINEFWASVVQEFSGARQHRARNFRDDGGPQLGVLHEFRIGVEGVDLLSECPLISDHRDNEPKTKRPRNDADEFEWSKVNCHAFSYDNQILDRTRDLGVVTLHFNMPDENDPSTRRLVHRKLFCFVVYTGDAQRIDSKTEVHKELFGSLTAEFKQPPKYKTNYHLVVKLKTEERQYLSFLTPGDLKKVMYAGAKLRDFRAVLSLGESRLFERILKPALHYPLFNPAALQAPPTASFVPTIVKGLNVSQRFVIHNVASRVLANNSDPEVMLLHGPPGTGKTLTIVSLIVQLLKGSSSLGHNMKILVCTPSNTAVDEIITRVVHFFNQNYKGDRPLMVRLGNEDTAKTNIGIDRLAEERCKQPTAVRSINKEIEDYGKLIKELDQKIGERKKKGERGTPELNQLYLELADYNKRLQKLTEDKKKLMQNGSARPARKDIENEKFKLLREANLIFSTLSSCASHLIQRCLGRSKRNPASSSPKITCCIIDEATQTTEPESLAPTLLDVSKLFLVGDPCQLPATVISQDASANNFGDSLFTRHYNYYRKQFKHEPSPVMYLEYQFRMHPEILVWPNRYFYGNKLKTISSVTQQVSNKSKLLPYVFLNLEGEEAKQSGDGKISNTSEVNLIVDILKILSSQKRNNPDLKNKPWTVGLVTPYNEQKKAIKEVLKKTTEIDASLLRDIEVDTIDSFQGREKDVMILSCVRSQSLGFLTSPNRLCVALTRARQSLIVIGNALCLNSNPMWKDLMDDAARRSLFKKISTSVGVKPNKLRMELEKAILSKIERIDLTEDPYERIPGVVTSRVQKWPHQNLRNS